MSVTVQQHKNFIGGEWIESEGGTMEVLNPSTGEVIAEVQRSTEADVDRAVEAAKRALPDWLEKTPRDRMELLLKLADVLDENAEELAKLESLNVGKPMSIVGDEVPFSADNLRFFAGAARTLEGKAAGEYVEGYTSIIRREPLGIVAGITPWNYPLMMVVWKLGPALAAGNVQILKPAEQTPLTTLRFVELAQEVLPPGVVQVVTGDGLPVGDALVRHPDIRLVSLTGDVETGKLIARNASRHAKRVHLELGGKAPMVVLDDADPAGRRGDQDRRLLELRPGLHGVVADPRQRVDLRRRARADEERRRGDEGRRPGRRRRHRHGPGDLEGAAGARARLPGAARRQGDRRDRRRSDRRPWLLRQADDRRRRHAGLRDRAARGLRAGRLDAALLERRRGDRDGERHALRARGVGLLARRRPCASAARKLEFGTVWVNEHLFPLASEMPHGGFKESGYGKDMSLYSMEEYTRIKHVAVKLT